jgi:hypothetical protein
MKHIWSGCNRCVQWGGKHKRARLFLRSVSVRSVFFLWVECPSQRSRIGFSWASLVNWTKRRNHNGKGSFCVLCLSGEIWNSAVLLVSASRKMFLISLERKRQHIWHIAGSRTLTYFDSYQVTLSPQELYSLARTWTVGWVQIQFPLNPECMFCQEGTSVCLERTESNSKCRFTSGLLKCVARAGPVKCHFSSERLLRKLERQYC